MFSVHLHGNLTDRIHALEIYSGSRLLLSLEDPDDGDHFADHGEAVTIGTERIALVQRQHGNAAPVSPEEVVRLLCHLKARSWLCVEGESRLFDIWHDPEQWFTREDLTR